MKDDGKTKQSLIDEPAGLRRESARSDTASNRHHQLDWSMAFLSQTATELVELSAEENIYQFIGEKLKELVADAVVIINSFDKQSDSLCTRALLGIDRVAERLLALLGGDPLGMRYPITDEQGRRALLSGKLVEGPESLYELSFGKIEARTCRAIEQLLAVGDIYAIGFAWKGELFGNAILITRKRAGARPGLRNRALIETFLHQAAVALQRRQAEEALQRAHDELEKRVAARTAELMHANEQLREEIEERARAEQALRVSEESYRQLADSITDVFFAMDENLTYVYWNKASEQITGVSAGDALGKSLLEIFPDTPQTRSAEKVYLEVLRTKQPQSFLNEYKLGGKEFFFEINAYPTIRGVSVIAKDLTEQRRAAQEKEKLQTQLQRAQKMETLGILAGEVAHDLSNVLFAVVGYPDLLLMQLPDDSPLRTPLAAIQDSGQKAAAMVQDLLTLARRGVPTAEAVDLNERITEYLKSPECEKLRFFHPDVVIETDLAADLFSISGSGVQLAKTVMNLVSNAAEAMKEGGTITLATENRALNTPHNGFEQVAAGEYMVFSVSDTGEGIAEEEIEKIFEPFYSKKKMGRSGTGLGMTVVWGTVKDHGGYIDVQSTPQEGTTVTLYFPATTKGPAAGKVPVLPAHYKGKGESILVIDELKGQRELAATILSELGYSVHTVSSGEEALAYLRDNRADLLILDMIMEPGIDGLDTYRRILKLHPNQKAVITSGFSDTDRVKEAQRLGAGCYLQKPYTIEKIGMAVREELAK